MNDSRPWSPGVLLALFAVMLGLCLAIAVAPVWPGMSVLTGLGLGTAVVFAVARVVEHRHADRSRRRLFDPLCLALISIGTVTLMPMQLVLSGLLVVGMVRLIGEPGQPRPVMAAAVIAPLAAVGIGQLAGTVHEVVVGGIVVAALGAGLGWIRHLRRRSRAQREELLAERLTAAEARAATAGLVERGRIARDLHDVLAHSLGALTVQLTAAQALQDQGRYEEVGRRIGLARQLSADGLVEARQAIAALHERSPDLIEGLHRLVEVHRSVGGAAELQQEGGRLDLDSGATEALYRVAQEALTNARKHAPGSAVRLLLRQADAEVLIQISNPLTSALLPLAMSGSRLGLVGAQDRMRQVGGRFRAGRVGADFVVEAAVAYGSTEDDHPRPQDRAAAQLSSPGMVPRAVNEAT